MPLITSAVIVVVGGLLMLAERLAPLRVRRERSLPHTIRNLSAGGVALAVMSLVQAPVLQPLAAAIVRHRLGVLQAVIWPRWLEVVLGIVLLDYTLWWWHWATHRVSLLWRFHLVHHVDLDLDASTALRFHFGELVLSILFRATQMTLIGVDVRTLWLWQTILFASILFHHSNLRLPMRFESLLVRLIVTPRMHGIHHSNRIDRTDSNWSSLLSGWDVLHGTMRFDVPDEQIVVGVPAYANPDDVTLGKILMLPFRQQREDWSS